jgi:predicted transcriptional regulator
MRFTIRFSDELGNRVKKRADQSNVSVNRYITDLVSVDLKHKQEKHDEIKDELTLFLGEHGRPMTYPEAMARFGKPYHWLYYRYRHLLAGEKRAREIKEELERAAAEIALSKSVLTDYVVKDDSG